MISGRQGCSNLVLLLAVVFPGPRSVCNLAFGEQRAAGEGRVQQLQG